jgi:uncharacterized lipoprotein YddW (UPF0748 family)
MRLIYTFIFFASFHFTLFSFGPKRELRGVWVATVSNIDWPSAKNYNGIKQQNEFIDLLNSHQKTGINAVFVQIRTAADALYAKSPEPWSTFLSGLQGQPPSPYYDPLAFMIEESHARGIEFHAWLNLNRASISENSLLGVNHVVRKHPDWIIKYHGTLILNFGLPEVRLYLVNLVKNIIEQYDVDGIHFDDYFYPYPIKGEQINDQEAFEKYKWAEESLGDWRRRNTNNLIKDISEAIKSTRPKVKFGISPFGIWRHQSESVLDGSPTRRGLQSYDDLFADTEKWIKDGWVDYLAPQLYWETTHQVAAFEPLATWWSTHNYGRPIYIGHAAYHLTDTWGPGELSKQLKVARSLANVQGSIYFSSNLIIRNVKGWRDTLRQNQFSSIALIPTMLWKDSIAPTPPRQVTLLKNSDDWLLSWKPGEPNEDQDPPAYYVVYRIKKGEFDPLDHSENIIFKGKTNQLILDKNWIRPGYGFAVTALDRLHNESLPGTIQWLIPTKKE